MDGRALRDEVAFFVDGIPHTWGDVVRDAHARGEWARVTREVAEGSSALDAADVEEAQREFRYEHGLVRAVDMESWLARWHLSLAEWNSYFRGTSADEDTEDRELIHAICSGALEEFADALALRAAAAAAVAPVSAAEAGDVDRRFAAFRERVVTDVALTGEIGARRLDWVRVRFRVLSFSTESAAQEAAMCVRHDGMDLADVAAEGRLLLAEEVSYLEEIEPTLRARLLGAREGEIIGPWKTEDQWALCELVTRTFPADDDDDLRGRAARVLIERTASLEAQQRVRWARAR